MAIHREHQGIMLVIAIFLAIFAIPLLSFAQSAVTLNADNPSPAPYATVNFTLTSSTVDLDRSDINWLVNDKSQAKRVGMKSFSYKMGALGTSVKITASVTTPEGGRVSTSMTIRPGAVNLLWEGISYTPPFYNGKALLPAGGAFTITAFPELAGANGKRLDPNKLTYAWEQDGTPLSSGSGYAKRSITLRGADIAKLKTTVVVTVSSSDGSVRAVGEAQIAAQEPYILFYERRQLEGTRYEMAARGNYEVRTPDAVMRAEPYYFSLDNWYKGELRYTWTLNGQSLPKAQEKSQEIAFESGGNASVVLRLSLKNTVRTLQSAVSSVTVVFGGQNKF